MATPDSFKPGAGGQQVTLAGVQNRGMGNSPLGGGIPSAPVLSQAPLPSHQQAQIGMSNSPKGAQPVSLAGAPPQGQPILGQSGARFQPPAAAPMPQGNLMGRSQGPSMDGEAHTIVVEGLAPDGKTYFAEYDAVFPRGTKVLGVTEKFGK